MIEKKYLEELNSWRNVELGKFVNISNFKIPNLDYKKENINQNSDCAIVYSIFHHIGYLKLCFLSILSQFTYTDIRDYNIFVICDNHLSKLVFNTIGKVIPTENIIVVDVSQKYYMFHVPEIQALKKVLMMDADGFMMGSYKDIYKEIFSKDEILLGQDNATFDDILRTRFHLSQYEALKNIVDYDLLAEKTKGKFWGFNCFSLHILKYVNIDYIPKIYWEQDFSCDETVLINNYFKQGLDYGYSNKYIRWLTRGHCGLYDFIRNILLDNREELSFVHPIVGETVDKKLYNAINTIFTLIIQKYDKQRRGEVN